MTGDEVIKEYTRWVKDNSFVREITGVSDTFAITTPFMDSSNDHIDLYVKRIDGTKLILSDDGFTISDLEMKGTEIFSTPRRKKTFDITLSRYGVSYDAMEHSLFIEASRSNIAAKKHALLQAVMAVGDLYVVSRENVLSFFKEDIEAYFRQNDIVFNKTVKLTGKTGFDHNIDFLIPQFRQRPEKLIQAINSPKKDQVMSAIFSFNDIAAIREERHDRIVIWNDESSNLSSESLKALDQYDVQVIPWSSKEQLVRELSVA